MIGRISREGVFFGLTLALPLIAVAALEAVLVWRGMANDSHAFVQQAIGDTTVVLASHFKGDFNHLSERLLALGNKVQSRASSEEGAQAAPVLDSFEFDHAFLDLSVFKRGEQVSAFDLDQVPRRTYWSLNSLYSRISQDLVKQIGEVEREEQKLIQAAFKGQSMVALAPGDLGPKGVALFALPLGQGSVVDEVVVTHLSLDVFSSILRREAMVSSSLVDQFGNILAHADSSLVAHAKINTQPLFKSMKASKMAGGQVTFTDSADQSFLGGYQKIGVSELAVLASVSEEEAIASLKAMRRQLLIFLSVSFILLFSGGYFVAIRFNFSRILSKSGIVWSLAGLKELTRTSMSSLKTPKEVAPRKAVVTLLYGSLRQPEKLLEALSPDEAIEVVNEFFHLAATVISHYGGTFEKQTGSSFLGVFGMIGGANSTDATEAARALRSIFDFRAGMVQLNQSRKNEGRKPLYASMGVDTGEVLIGRMGGESKSVSVLGDSLLSAKGLDRLTAQKRVDVLVSQYTWKLVEKNFEGETLGESKLTPSSGVSTYYSLKGYRNSEGQIKVFEGEVFPTESEKEVLHDGSTASDLVVAESKPSRWSVNNGSQIVGPLTPTEIAARLFAQELDFDCECWAEGTGKSAHLRTAGIFLGSDDQDAKLWTYDGEMIQGPFSAGFLKTALLHGAMPFTVYVCEESTVQGWKKLDERPELTAAAAAPEPTAQWANQAAEELFAPSTDQLPLQTFDLGTGQNLSQKPEATEPPPADFPPDFPPALAAPTPVSTPIIPFTPPPPPPKPPTFVAAPVAQVKPPVEAMTPPVTQPVAVPVAAVIAEPVAELAVAVPVAEVIGEPIAEPVAELAVAVPVAEVIGDPIAEPVAELAVAVPVAEVIGEPTAEPVAELAVAVPVAEVIGEPIAEPVAEPAIAVAVAEVVAEPVIEAVPPAPPAVSSPAVASAPSEEAAPPSAPAPSTRGAPVISKGKSGPHPLVNRRKKVA